MICTGSIQKFRVQSSTVIKGGYGDFIFAKKGETGRFSSITLDEYKQISPLIQSWIFRPPASKIKELVQERLGTSVHPIFIPNTLYGLYYIEECIRERVQLIEEAKEDCPTLMSVANQLKDLANEQKGDKKQLQRRGGFWPLCYYSNNDYLSNRISKITDARSDHLIEVGSVLNEKIVTRLEDQLSPEGLSYKHIKNQLGLLIEFHKNMNDPQSLYFKKISKAIHKEQTVLGSKSFLSHFFYFSGYEYAIAIGNDPQVQKTIENSVELECNPELDQSIIVYRGARLMKESLVNESGNILSLSFGSRLLAGSIHDGGAMALSYCGQPGRQMLAYVIPKDAIKKDETPFFIPESSSLEQFCSGGEGFHPRTVVPHEMVDRSVFGSLFMKNKKFVGSSKSIEEINHLFQKYQEKAIHL